MLQNIKEFIKRSIKNLFRIDIKYIIIAVLLGVIYFLFQNPKIETIKVPVEIEVEVPGKTGEIRIDSIPVPYKVSVKNPLNKDLERKYNEANDSIKKLLFIMAVAEKEYNISFKDSVQNIDVYTKIINGKLKDQFVNYEIFPSKQVVKTEVELDIPRYNKLYYGVEIYHPPTLNLQQPTFSAGVMLKNKNDNIWKLTYNTRNEIGIGYYKSF